jgi:hypothetical protein
MKKFILCAVVAGAWIMGPSIASATHVPSTTYTGETTSGAEGGTLFVDVSADGSEVSINFNGLGHATNPCTGVGFEGTTPISNDHTFSFLSKDGFKSYSGGFGAPGEIAGSVQVLTMPCTTGSQSFVASAAVSYPDARIAGKGNDVYNKNADGQLAKKTLKRGKTANIPFAVQNDGSATQSFNSSGCESAKGFKVSYFDGVEDVTPFFTNGNVFFSGQLAEGESKQVSLRIKAPNGGRKPKKLTCVITTELPGTNEVVQDVVAAEVKVKRKRKRR